MDFVGFDSTFSFAERLIEPAAQRLGLRRSIRTECQVVTEEGFHLIAEETLDVSDRGLLVASHASACIGETVFVSLRLPRGQTWIDAEGRVVRVVRGLRNGDAGRGFGIRFERIDDFDLILLRSALDGVPPSVPARRVRPDYAATVATIMFPVLKRLRA